MSMTHNDACQRDANTDLQSQCTNLKDAFEKAIILFGKNPNDLVTQSKIGDIE